MLIEKYECIIKVIKAYYIFQPIHFESFVYFLAYLLVLMFHKNCCKCITLDRQMFWNLCYQVIVTPLHHLKSSVS